MMGNLKRVFLGANQRRPQSYFYFFWLVSWRMMPVACSFSLNPGITRSSSVRKLFCVKHTPEVFLGSPFSPCPVSPLHILWCPWLGSFGFSGHQRLIREGKVAEMGTWWLKWCYLARKGIQKMHLGWFLAQPFVDGVCCLRAQFCSSGGASRRSEPCCECRMCTVRFHTTTSLSSPCLTSPDGV